VAEYGFNNFTPYLTDIILGKPTTIKTPYIMGGPSGKLPAANVNSMYRVSTSIWMVGEKALLVVKIRLFSFLVPPAPIYIVVAGEFPDCEFSND